MSLYYWESGSLSHVRFRSYCWDWKYWMFLWLVLWNYNNGSFCLPISPFDLFLFSSTTNGSSHINEALTTQRRVRGFRVVILSVTSLNPWWASTISTMVIAPSRKNTISLTSPDACASSETAISVEGAYKRYWNKTRFSKNYSTN